MKYGDVKTKTNEKKIMQKLLLVNFLPCSYCIKDFNCDV